MAIAVSARVCSSFRMSGIFGLIWRGIVRRPACQPILNTRSPLTPQTEVALAVSSVASPWIALSEIVDTCRVATGSTTLTFSGPRT